MLPIERPPAKKRRYLRALVYEKNRWDEPLSAEDKVNGFLGWHERGYLPHCDKPGLVQFVTLRLANSMPAARRSEWRHLLKIEDARERRRQLETYLDRGIGECWLRVPQVAALTEQALLFHNQVHYDLRAWCVMPNHVHVLLHIWDRPLSKILQNWKSVIAIQANRILGNCGPFWQREYWDTFMRDTEQERKAVHYTEANPIKAGLCKAVEEWHFTSARFRDAYERLAIPSTTVGNRRCLS
jgi:REP element-mobilizing transposase RayT